MTNKTPQSDGVFLNERECAAALKEVRLLKRLGFDLERVSEYHKIELVWLRDWPDRHGIYKKLNDGSQLIKIPHSTSLGERIAFYHELHHSLYAPAVIAFQKLSREEIARWEGKADSFASLVVMPLLPDGNDNSLDEIEIYRLFGPHHKVNAHYRIQHARHYGC